MQDYIKMALDMPGASRSDLDGHPRIYIPHPLGSFTYAEGGMVGCQRSLIFSGAQLTDSNLELYQQLLEQTETMCELFDLGPYSFEKQGKCGLCGEPMGDSPFKYHERCPGQPPPTGC